MGTVHVDNVNTHKRYDFPGTALPSNWSVLSLGAGQTVSVASSIMTIAMGTTASAETIVRCSTPISIKALVRFIFSMSQRIVNQNVYLEITNTSGNTWARWNLNGATATSGQIETANQGTANTAVSLTIPTTAAYASAEIYLENEQAIFSTTVSNSSTAKGVSGLFDRLIPEPGEDYFVQIRCTNSGSVPASNTNVLIDAVLIEDLTMVGVEILRASGDLNPATALPVRTTGGAVDTVTAVTTAYTSPKTVRYTDTIVALAGAATYTGTGRDSGSTATYAFYRVFVNADQVGNIYIEQSSDNAAWFVTQTSAIVANTPKVLEEKIVMRYVRVRYVNGATLQGAFKLDTILSGN